MKCRFRFVTYLGKNWALFSISLQALSARFESALLKGHSVRLRSQSGACLFTRGVISFVKSRCQILLLRFFLFVFCLEHLCLYWVMKICFIFCFLLEALKKGQLIVGIIHIKFTLLRHAGYCS